MKVAQMEKAGLAALIDLAEGSGMVQLKSVLENRVTEECLSLYNIDGSMCKTAKCKLLEMFNLEPVAEKPCGHVSLVDMGLIWRLATPTAEDRESKKRDGSEYHWSGYLDKIALSSSHATLMHASSSSSTTSMISLSASKMINTIDGQQCITTFQMFIPSPKTRSQELASSTNSWSIPETRSDYRSLLRNILEHE